MTGETELLLERRVRSPRSAAIAGVLFALLMATSMFLITSVTAVAPADVSSDLLESESNTVSLALGLVPFAGIAFLWFTGVIRDHIGDREDQFFATVFLGSGIVFVVMIFVWAATIGAVFASYAVAADLLVDNDIFIFGFSLMREIIGNYALRMAGVYMLSISTLWTRAGVMPRWLTLTTYIVALGFLFFAGATRQARFLFPAWVLVVSVYVLITNRRISRRASGTSVD